MSRSPETALIKNLGTEPSCVSKPADAPADLPKSLPCKYEAHHLIGIEQAMNFNKVQGGRKLVMMRAKELGYDINRANNGAYFPTYGDNYSVNLEEGQQYAYYYAKLPLHKGPHHGKLVGYTTCVTEHLDQLDNDYKAGRVDDCEICSELTKIENKLRAELIIRNLWLTKHDIHPRVVDSVSNPNNVTKKRQCNKVIE